MKLVKTEDAVGMVLCHDITQIIKGVTKDAVFRKGHIIREEDIPVLLNCGKENVYVLELGKPGMSGQSSDNRTSSDCDRIVTDEEYGREYGRGMIHENEAASFLCDLCQGANLRRGCVKEGKLEMFAECDGLLKVNEAGVRIVNSAGQMMIASRHGNFPVKKNDKIAGTRIIPLVIEEEKLLKVRERIAKLDDKPLYSILSFRHKRAAIIATGSEVQKGRIKDTFTPVIEGKLSEYDAEVVYRACPGDDHEAITEEIMSAVNEYGADMVLCTGGMSVDPDDRTPLAIRNTGADIVCYGAPVLPGAMFMLAYLKRPETAADREEGNESAAVEDDCAAMGNRGEVCNNGDASVKKARIPVMGLPGCVMFHGRTIFDLVLPRIMADDPVSSDEITALGTGGMCLNCETCTFPNCGFGK